MQIQELIAIHLNVSPSKIVKIVELYKVWCVVVEGCRGRFVSKLQVLGEEIKTSIKVQVKTGSEWHTTERRGAMVKVNGKPIYQVLNPVSQEWELVGNKGKHGKWCVAEYELPVGAKIEFSATANGRDAITHSFVVGEVSSVDVDGYGYGSDICGWIVSI
jgi:hypothetical protein